MIKRPSKRTTRVLLGLAVLTGICLGIYAGDLEPPGAPGPTMKTLDEVQPGIRDKLCDTEGNLRRFVNLYLNEKDVRLLENLETNVTDGDIISIVPTIAGG